MRDPLLKNEPFYSNLEVVDDKIIGLGGKVSKRRGITVENWKMVKKRGNESLRGTVVFIHFFMGYGSVYRKLSI